MTADPKRHALINAGEMARLVEQVCVVSAGLMDREGRTIMHDARALGDDIQAVLLKLFAEHLSDTEPVQLTDMLPWHLRAQSALPPKSAPETAPVVELEPTGLGEVTVARPERLLAEARTGEFDPAKVESIGDGIALQTSAHPEGPPVDEDAGLTPSSLETVEVDASQFPLVIERVTHLDASAVVLARRGSLRKEVRIPQEVWGAADTAEKLLDVVAPIWDQQLFFRSSPLDDAYRAVLDAGLTWGAWPGAKQKGGLYASDKRLIWTNDEYLKLTPEALVALVQKRFSK